MADPLTGALNRRFLSNLNGVEGCLIFLDLDGFKEYNDTHGHPAGDVVLSTIASLLRNNVRKIDIPARYGGEEFAVILPHTLPHHARKIADTLCSRLSEFDILGDGSLHITVSIGLVFHTGDTPPNLDRLLQQADRALYQAKQNGRNQAVLYDPEETTSDKE